MIRSTTLAILGLAALAGTSHSATPRLAEAALVCQQTADELKGSKDIVAYRSWQVGHNFLKSARQFAERGHSREAGWAATRAIAHFTYPRRAADKWLALATPYHDRVMQAGLAGEGIARSCRLVRKAHADRKLLAFGYARLKAISAVGSLTLQLQQMAHSDPTAREILSDFVAARLHALRPVADDHDCRAMVRATLTAAAKLHVGGHDLAAYLLLCKANALRSWHRQTATLHRHRKQLSRRVARALAHGCDCGASDEAPPEPDQDDADDGNGNGNNGVGNGEDPQPPGNPPVNDGPGTGPGNPGNRGGANR